MTKPLCLITFIMFTLWLPPAHAQSFSCSIGTPACLGYSDKVVSSDETVLIATHALETSSVNRTYKMSLTSMMTYLMNIMS